MVTRSKLVDHYRKHYRKYYRKECKTKEPFGENKDSLGAYFTVEASMVYPMVLAVILLVMYIWFFLYDRCLMEQDYAGIMVKSAVQQEMSLEERFNYAESQIENLYKKQYLCWEWGETGTEIGNGKVTVSISGSLEFPFGGLNFWNDDNIWEADRQYEGKIYNRMFLIRTYRKIKSLVNN